MIKNNANIHIFYICIDTTREKTYLVGINQEVKDRKKKHIHKQSTSSKQHKDDILNMNLKKEG